MKWSSQHWSWVIEILVIAVAIYHTWKLFHGTRGARVLSGLVILLFTLTLFSTFLHLRVVSQILTLFSPFFFTALVVLFQPELRQMLAELGSKPIVTTTRQQSEAIEHIVNTMQLLQSEKLGALIAVEQEDVFLPARDTGTILQAQLSVDLLATIFYPKTPLHDGGVIIRGNQIVVAAAIFPLTRQEQLDRALGLRHRAALGLTEETDAVVVVISEETGIISVVYDGKLERPFDADGLRARLTQILL